MRLISFVLGIFLAFVLTTSIAAKDTYSQIIVTKFTKQQFLEIHQRGLDVAEYLGDNLRIIAKPADLEWLKDMGIPFEVEISDLVAHYQSRNKENRSMGGFMTFSEIVQHLDDLKATYPTIMSDKFSIGQSLEGNELWVVKVSDNPEIDEDEPEVFYVSLIHSREPAAGAALLHFLEHMLSGYGVYTEISDLIDNRELYFMPVQNPDGYLFNEADKPGGGGLWRKNRRQNPDFSNGVDLNRNYGYQWGFDNVGSSPNFGSETYRGPSPFSEPETQAYRDFVISRNFVIIHNIHTYSDLELWSPGYDRFFTPFDDLFKNIGDSMTQFNGYTAQVGWRLYPTNGAADDWCWGDTISKPPIISFTCEIGGNEDGFWPPPANIPGLVQENIWPNLFLAQIADNPYAQGPPLAPTVVPPDTVAKAGDYTVSWAADDTLNPAVSYTLYELTDKSTVIDDAEEDYGYWDTERFMLTSIKAHSGTDSWTEQANNRSNHWLVASNPYEVMENDSLRFWIWYDIENNWDYFYVQISTDGGFVYTNLENDMTTDFNPNGTNIGNGITGTSGNQWVEAKFDLSAYQGQQVNFRLSYFTDYAVLNEGVYIDDIENIDFFGIDSVLSANEPDTFYNISNKEPGDYWYRVDAIDAEDQVSRLSNIVAVQVPLPYVVGDANGDDDVNILDLTFLVDRVFRGGPLPDPFLSGDSNCDADVNILDLTFMVDYIFRGGPLPSCPN